MRHITILNQGTMNDSTDRKGTSGGHELVISKIAALMAGAERVDWIHNEGAGTAGLKAQGAKTNGVSGTLWGAGVEANVQRAVDLVKKQKDSVSNGPGGITVDLVGHSRGSITCYKIARALRDDPATATIPVNIFAIDPVPGNLGVMNHRNWKDIALGNNLLESFLLLAESDRRLPFRPYVDALYSMGMPTHKFDTIPGTHGGINELEGDEKEAASIVLSRALKFLKKVSGGTSLIPNAENHILDGNARLEKYSQLMQRIRKYKKHGKALGMWAVGMLRMEDRHVMVHGDNKEFGAADKGGWTGVDTAESQSWARGGYHGVKMTKALGAMMPAGQEAHSMRADRYFANLDHQRLFGKKYGSLATLVEKVERGGTSRSKVQPFMDMMGAHYATMARSEKTYFDGWLAKLGLTPPA